MNADKPGWQTTEFWLSAVAALVGLLLASGAIPAGSSLDKGLGLITAGMAALGYSVARGVTKSGVARGAAAEEAKTVVNPPGKP